MARVIAQGDTDVEGVYSVDPKHIISMYPKININKS